MSWNMEKKNLTKFVQKLNKERNLQILQSTKTDINVLKE